MEAAREFCQEVQTKRRVTKEMEPDYLNSLLKGVNKINAECTCNSMHYSRICHSRPSWKTQCTCSAYGSEI